MLDVSHLAGFRSKRDPVELPDGLDAMAPGPLLGTYLAMIDSDRLSLHDRVVVLRTIDRMASHYQAMRLDAINAVVDGYREEMETDRLDAAEAAATEIRAALVKTRRAADADVLLAHAVATRIPEVGRLLATGDLDLARVRVIDQCTDHLSAATAQRVVERLGDGIGRLTTGQLAARIRAVCIEADPDDASRRQERSVDQRSIGMQPDPDGTAHIIVHNVAPDAAVAAMGHVDALARSLKSADETRSMDQLRTDVAMDLLAGRTVEVDRSQRTGAVEIRADIETLSGLADHPGHLHGYGPVIADIARQVADGLHDAEWRWTVTDVDSHRPILTGTTRRRPTRSARTATAWQRRAIVGRDATCAFPGCRMPATVCEIDHIEPFGEGGPTELDNLAPLCTHDHQRTKHTHRWRYSREPEGGYSWRSPSGHTYRSGDPPRDRW